MRAKAHGSSEASSSIEVGAAECSIYEHPRNLFVAEFIGSPAMNLVMADLERSDGDVWVSFADHRLRLDPSMLESRSALSRFEGRRVVVGIRPEDMEDAAVLRETHEDRRMSVVCDIREDLGSEVCIHFNVPGEPVTAKEVVEALVVDAPEDAETRLAASGHFRSRFECWHTQERRERVPASNGARYRDSQPCADRHKAIRLLCWHSQSESAKDCHKMCRHSQAEGAKDRHKVRG